MRALPIVFYGDPASNLDAIRAMRERAERMAERHRRHKGRRIRALVKRAMSEGGGHGKR